MERWVAAAAGGGLSDVAGAPALLVAAVVGDLEDAPLVEVQPASLALQPLQSKDVMDVHVTMSDRFEKWNRMSFDARKT